MSALAKAGTVGIIAASTGVAFIPVINTFIDNPKSKVHVYEFNGRLFKSKDAAESARKKFTAMSGLISAMEENDTLDPNLDYKPLMAEFVSFVSKLFTVKVFQMDDETTKENHFKYDGLSKEQKEKLFEEEVNGQIKYGDLKDITSLVKYATAHKEGNEWMFTPVDEMLLSIIGDGSGQAYSQNELDYADLTKQMQKLKDTFSEHFKAITSIGGLSYSLVHGMTHYNNKNLEMADKTKPEDSSKVGDMSGDLYTQEFINKYVQWGTLKKDFENAKIDLNGFVSANNINPAMKEEFLRMVSHNAVSGWNNKERYSADEIELRDLIAKVASQTQMLQSQTIPGNHPDTSVNIVEGWNWKPTGDASDRAYSDWQLDLAENIQNRQKLLSMHIAPAPEEAVLGLNDAAIGDGTGNTYDPRVFELRDQLKASEARIDELSSQIDLATSANTKPAPANGEVSPSGKHLDAIGLGDGIDHTEQSETHSVFAQLKEALKAAQEAKAQLEQAIGSTDVDTNNEDGHQDSMQRNENEMNLLSLLQFDIVKQGWNWNKNYNEDQVNYAKALDKAADLRQKIQALENNGVVAAKEGASTTNKPPRGVEDGKVYAQEQLDLRDYKQQLKELGQTLGAEHDQNIQRAPEHALPNTADPNLHEAARGLANGETYSSEFIEAGRRYRSYLAKLQGVQEEIASIKKEYPGLVTKTGSHTSFEDLYKNHAVSGENTGEQFSAAEVKYTKDKQAYDLLVTALSDANDALLTFRSSVTSDKYAEQLSKDFSEHLTPISGENVKATGDGTGNVYTQDDVKFRDALKTLKHTFPHGNPWWTDTKDKTSDEAYYALYDDWKDAISKGTQATNSAKVGDGTEHTFNSDNFKTFDTFFRKAFQDLHGSDTARAQQVSSDFDTILKYIQDHGDLRTKSYGASKIGNGGWVTLTDDKWTTSGEREFGDGSGHKYLNLYDLYRRWSAYANPNSSSNKNVTNAQKALDDLQSKITGGVEVAAAQKLIDDYQAKIDARQKAIDALQVLTDQAADLLSDADKKYHDQGDKADSLKRWDGHSFKEDLLKDMAKIDVTKDNHAVAPTQEAADKLDELKQLKDDIKDAKKVLKSKNEDISKMQSSHRDFFLRYQSLGKNLPVVGKNYIGSGDQSGNTYSSDQIDGRDIENEIETEIKKHSGVSLSDELSKLDTLKENSVKGDNTNKASGNAVGDTSGQHWDDWEIALKVKVFKLRSIRSNLNRNNKGFAPKGAEEGLNPKPTGDRTGNTYASDDEFITKFLPEYQALLSAQKTASDNLDGLNDRKDDIDKLGLDEKFLKDPNVYYVTSGGKSYKLTDIANAKIWLVQHELKNTLEQAKKDADKAKKTADKNLKDAKDDKDDYNKWTKGISDQNKVIEKYSPKALEAAKKTLSDRQKVIDDDKKYVKDWWEKSTENGHKTVYLDTASKDRNFAGDKIAATFDEFTSWSNRDHEGTINTLYHILASAHADTRGRTNNKADGYFTEEEIKLKNALVDVIDLPSEYSNVQKTDYYSYIFNALIVMYKNAIDDGYSAKEEFWSTGRNAFTSSFISSTTIHDSKGHSFDGKVYSRVTLKDHSAGAMVSFKEWINQYLSGDTEKINHAFKGDGTGKVYKDEELNFFVDNGNKIDSVRKLDSRDFDLGQAAFTVKIFSTRPNKMTSKSIQGINKVATGDKSGNTYSDDDLKYFRAYQVAQKAKTDTDNAKKTLDADIPTDGTTLNLVPSSYTGAGTAKHSLPVGDGSGNTYTDEEITAAKRYYALLSLQQDDQDLIDALEKEWNEKVLTDKRTWDEVKAIDAIAEVGWNHDVLWSAAEIKYDGDNIKQDDLLSKIAGLESGTIADPNFHGSGTPPQIKITQAPAGAVLGLNNALEGLGDNEIFELKQIEKRDWLKDLNKQLDDIMKTIQEFIDKKTVAAPDAGIVPVKMKDWHPTTIGDGSNKFYSSKIFDDRLKIASAEQEVKQTTKALEDFKAKNGEAALEAIEQEIKNGMVDGVNEEVKYSIAEIALRDNIAYLGDEQSKFKLLQGDINFNRQKLLTEKSIPGENTAAKGMGNNHDYSKEEIDLRDIDKLIKSIEELHGIKSEEDIVSYDDLFTGKKVITGLNIREYYNKIDLSKAQVGENHAAHGDQSDAFYTDAELNTFNDIVALQEAIAKNKDRIAELLREGVKPAPQGEEAISAKDIFANPADYGKHKAAVGDATGNNYDQAKFDMAQEYVLKLETLSNDETKYANFIKEDENLVKFFEIKTAVDPATGLHQEWNPVVGRNWSQEEFDLKELFDKREELKVGRTMVDSSPKASSELGTNRGYLGKEATHKDNLVMYEEEKDKDIKDELLGSDKARIGYVLKIHGQISDESPVLDSLQAVASYIQVHQDLAPDGLIEKFSLLQNMGIEDTSKIYEITEETVSKDRYNAMAANYEWGDK